MPAPDSHHDSDICRSALDLLRAIFLAKNPEEDALEYNIEVIATQLRISPRRLTEAAKAARKAAKDT